MSASKVKVETPKTKVGRDWKPKQKTKVCKDCGRLFTYFGKGGRRICNECAEISRHGSTWKKELKTQSEKRPIGYWAKVGVIKYEEQAFSAIRTALPCLPRELASKITAAMAEYDRERIRRNIDGLMARADARRKMARPVDEAVKRQRVTSKGHTSLVESRSGMGWGGITMSGQATFANI